MGTREGRIYINETSQEIRETILDAQENMKQSAFWWDQWKIGDEEKDEFNLQQIRKDIPEEMDKQQMFDSELNSLITSKNQRIKSEMEGRYEYQNAHNGTQLMVHANPYFKYPKSTKSKMPKLSSLRKKNSKSIKNPGEKEGNVLFLNKGSVDSKTPYKAKALSRVKSELNTLRTLKSTTSRNNTFRSQNTQQGELPRVSSMKKTLKNFPKQPLSGPRSVQIERINLDKAQMEKIALQESNARYAHPLYGSGQKQPQANFMNSKSVLNISISSNNQLEKQPGKLYSNKSKRRFVKNMESANFRAKLLYQKNGADSSDSSRFSRGKVRNIDTVIKFKSTKLAPKEGQSGLYSKYSNLGFFGFF